MDGKDHWAWEHFSGPEASRDQLLIHYQQEYLTYIRDFPLFLGRIHGRCPDAPVRRLLAENLYEEETGGISRTAPHPELFLEMMEGLGFRRSRFLTAGMLPAARAYRGWIDTATTSKPWIVGAAVVTLFVEGSLNERREISGANGSGPREFDPRSDMLVRHHGLDPEFLTLKKAHARVEGDHRTAAWTIIEKHAGSRTMRETVARAMRRSLRMWLAYRDQVARSAGLEPASSIR
jgi:pyrroloquinoline-quinone synthase